MCAAVLVPFITALNCTGLRKSDHIGNYNYNYSVKFPVNKKILCNNIQFLMLFSYRVLRQVQTWTLKNIPKRPRWYWI